MAELTQSQKESLKLGPLTLVLTILAFLASVSVITGEILEADGLTYVLKPVIMALIILVAFISLNVPSRVYKWAIIVGLTFSLAGDVLLMLPQDLFLWGLIAFAAAQLAYIAAFTAGGFHRNFRSAAPFVLFGIFMAVFLWSGMEEDGVLIPGLIYLVIIMVMAWQGYGNWRQTLETRTMLAFAGALLFVASDSFLALNRFMYDLGDLAPILVLGTYYPAQWLIAQSTGRKHI